METLPPEMIREILQYLEPEHLLQVKETSKRMQNITNRVFWSRYRRDVLLLYLRYFREDLEGLRSGEDFDKMCVHYLLNWMNCLRDIFHHWGGRRKPSFDLGCHPPDFDEWDVLSFQDYEMGLMTSPRTTEETIQVDFGKYFDGITTCISHDEDNCHRWIHHESCHGICKARTQKQRADCKRLEYQAGERWLALLGDLVSESERARASEWSYVRFGNNPD